MRKELEDKLAKLFSVPADSPSYDELFVFLEDAESELRIAQENLRVVTEAWKATEQSLHAAWNVLNYIEDLQEDLLSATITPDEKQIMLANLFDAVKTV